MEVLKDEKEGWQIRKESCTCLEGLREEKEGWLADDEAN